MFWTNFIKFFTKLGMVLSIIACIILGIRFIDESAILGIVIIVGGALLVLLTNATAMMICEISENIYLIRQNTQTGASTNPVSKDIWHCPICAKTNPQSNSTCSKCGYKKLS